MKHAAATILNLALAVVACATTPAQAVGWAIAHQAETPEDARPFYRYLWIPEWVVPDDHDSRHVAAAVSYAINECASQTGIIVQPRTIANGWMLAVYLPNYASPTKASLADSSVSELDFLAETWDSLAADDPYFHVTEEVSELSVAVVAPHVTAEHAELLATLNDSAALVYRVDWFLERLTRTNYHEFMQLGTARNGFVERVLNGQRQRTTQLDVYASIGVNEELAKRLDGDQRAALFASGVTGKPRRVDRLQGALGRSGTGAVWQTWDVFDESIEIRKHPLYNLLAFVVDGGEVIFERSNGLHGYLLVNGDRELVTEAPPNLAADHTIPSPPNGPGSKRLEPAISCIRCHGPDDGLHPVRNDVQALLSSGTDIIDDLGDLTKDSTENVLRIAGLYTGNFDRRLTLGREDYELAVRVATQMPGVAQGMSVPETASLLSELFANYAYRQVDARQACLELGLDPGEEPREVIRSALKGSRQTESSIVFENVVVASMLAGIPVRRGDWEQVYAGAQLGVGE